MTRDEQQLMETLYNQSPSYHQLYKYIYSEKREDLDTNLTEMFDFLKGQSKKIYYDRKVEYVNLVEQYRRNQEIKEETLQRKKRRDQEGYISEYQKR